MVKCWSQLETILIVLILQRFLVSFSHPICDQATKSLMNSAQQPSSPCQLFSSSSQLRHRANDDSIEMPECNNRLRYGRQSMASCDTTASSCDGDEAFPSTKTSNSLAATNDPSTCASSEEASDVSGTSSSTTAILKPPPSLLMPNHHHQHAVDDALDATLVAAGANCIEEEGKTVVNGVRIRAAKLSKLVEILIESFSK